MMVTNPARLIAALLLTASVVAAAAWAQYVPRPDERDTLGKRVPDAWFVTDNGDTVAIRDLAGSPLVVSPVFTTCPHICPAITSSLVSSLDGLGGIGETFNVLTLSFDPEDDAADLRAYREKTGMPREWILASGVPDQIDPLLRAIDFRYESLSAGGFAHANVVAFLSPDLTVSGYLYGLLYTTEDVKAALRVAAGQRPLVERARPILLIVGLLALVVTAFVIVFTARRAQQTVGDKN
jgi:protein SCO1/2